MMSEAPQPSPEDSLARNDPGDETANRYRFQYTWAAIMCCALLDETEDVVEVFCEHHEDVLLKHRDGSFTGHQVKTRGNDQPLWKAKDEAVVAACARFAKLDTEFPGRFRGFCFLTNHPFHSAGNGQDLPHILQLVKDTMTLASLPSYVTSWIRRVGRLASVTEVEAFAAISKTEAKADLPKLHDAVVRLVATLSLCWAPASECSYDAVEHAAQSLIDECSRASALAHEQLLPGYFVATANTNNAIRTSIDSKRMTLARVEATLEEGRDLLATLVGDPESLVEPGTGSTELLHRKLDAGGFSAVSRNSAEDLRNKADYLCIGWTKRYRGGKGLARYDHIRSLVLSDAGRAFDEVQSDDDRFGPAMRENLRQRIRSRRDHGDQLYDCTDEHLEGIAFSLTAQCRVMWSHARPWENQ